MKPVKSFRIAPDLLEKAKKKNIDLVKLFEAALAKALKDNKCPYCGKQLNNK